MDNPIRLGSLLVNNVPVQEKALYSDGANVLFTNAIPGYELLWFPISGTKSLVSCSTILANISWRQLYSLGFIDGKTFELDGRICHIRLPWLGVRTDDKNELSNVELPDGKGYWGREQFIGFDSGKPKQMASARQTDGTWVPRHPSEKHLNLGFLPVIDFGLSR